MGQQGGQIILKGYNSVSEASEGVIVGFRV
jgi:hypothetical protein